MTSGTTTSEAAGSTAARGRKSVVGEVVSDKMQKTITVRVDRLEKHAQYRKYLRRTTTLKAHDEHGEAHIGDEVRIEETRPLSKTKRWRLVEIIRQSRRAQPGEADALADIEAGGENAQ